jgi:uncharacterized membrane protein YgdD (TMEM256/DUF423 family)
MGTHPLHRLSGLLGALIGLASVVLAAVASHAWSGRLGAQDLHRVHLAFAFGFGHALLLVQIAALMRSTRGVLIGISAVSTALGVVLFSGSLLGRALAGWPSTLAPIGGGLLMLGWLALATWFIASPSRQPPL